MSTESELRAPMQEFAEKRGDYYADTFLKLQKKHCRAGI